MGSFDTVNAKCPICDARVDYQSKAGKCRLDKFPQQRVPAVIAANLDGAKEECKNCGAVVVLRSRSAPQVEMYVHVAEMEVE